MRCHLFQINPFAHHGNWVKILAVLLVGFSASIARSEEFVCGFVPPEDGATGASGTVNLYREGTVRPMILYGEFNGAENNDSSLLSLSDREGRINQSAANFLSITHEGSLSHYFFKMSHRKLTLAPPLTGSTARWYESSDDEVSDYVGSPCATWYSGVKRFVQEVIVEADAEGVDFSQTNMVAVITPRDFGDECSKNGTVFYNLSLPTPVDGKTRLDRVITADYRGSFAYIVGVLAHEYGHAMDLPELFDRTHQRDKINSASHSAGIGRWGVMASGNLGWEHTPTGKSDPVNDGPNPMSMWSRVEVEWVDPVVLEADQSGVEVQKVTSSSNSAYKIPISESEYFLVSNRQKTGGSAYDIYMPEGGSGLAIWHIDEDAGSGDDANEYERHKRVDLECADGLFSDRGYPGNTKDVEAGGDNLDYTTCSDVAAGCIPSYQATRNGNVGDATDLWDGSSHTQFTPDTNPSTGGYEQGFIAKRPQPIATRQNVFTGVFIENIRPVSAKPGVMAFDLQFAPLAPNSLDAAIGEGRVELTWEAPNPNPATIASYKVRHRLSSSTSETDWMVSDPLGKSVTSHTVTGLTNDSEYTFEVFAVASNNKEGEPASITAIPQQTIKGDSSPEFEEIPDNTSNWERLVGRYEKAGSYRWDLEGDDDGKFELSGSGGVRELLFLNPPNFEAPTSADGDNFFEITITVEETGASGASETPLMKPVTVEVTNENERGMVTVTPDRYQVDVELTATLTDPDSPDPNNPPTGINWQWKRGSVFDHNGILTRAPNLPDPIMGATDSRYTPVAEDIGYELIAEVGYTDGHGPEKKELSPLPVPPKVVVDVPSAPGNLRAAPRDRAVLLTWDTPPDNGSALTRYDYRQSTDGGTTWSPDWGTIPLPSGTTAADLEEHTVTSLTNGTVYTFEVRAVNEVGDGAAAQVTMPPENLAAEWVLDGLDIFADHKVTLTWDDPGDTPHYGMGHTAEGGLFGLAGLAGDKRQRCDYGHAYGGGREDVAGAPVQGAASLRDLHGGGAGGDVVPAIAFPAAAVGEAPRRGGQGAVRGGV